MPDTLHFPAFPAVRFGHMMKSFPLLASVKLICALKKVGMFLSFPSCEPEHWWICNLSWDREDDSIRWWQRKSVEGTWSLTLLVWGRATCHLECQPWTVMWEINKHLMLCVPWVFRLEQLSFTLANLGLSLLLICLNLKSKADWY